MPTSCNVIRALLMPGIMQHQGDRGIAFTEDEIEAVVGAWVEAEESNEDQRSGLDAAVRMLHHLSALPLTVARRQRDLAALHSVSPAYRRSQLPEPFRASWVATARMHR